MARISCLVTCVLVLLSVGIISAKDVSQKQEVNDAVTCELCEFAMNELDKLLGNNATEEEIKAALEKVCSYLPTTVQDECTRLVDDYAVEIIDLIVKGLSPKMVCTQLGLCTSQVSQTFPGPQCEICKMVLGKLADMLTSNSTEAEIENALEKVCSLLPSTYKDECDKFVEEYTKTIIQLITHEVGPEAICALLQLCSTDQKQVALKPVVDDSAECALCEFIMKQVDNLLANNATEEEIQAALEKVCTLLPTTISAECDEFIKDYLPALIQLLVSEVKPNEVCTLLKFCDSSKSKVSLKTVLLTKATKVAPKNVEVKVDSDENCALCEFVMRELDEQLSKNATEEEITKLVENICTILPGTLNKQCTSFLGIYGPTLITLLVQQLEPEKICTAIGLCSKNPKLFTSNPLKGPIKDNTVECTICEFVLSELKDLIAKNSTEEEIKQALDDVCDLLPSTLKTSCLVFVNKYADAICKLIAAGIDPTQICTVIGFCTQTVTTSDDECDLCQILVKFADDYVRNNSTEEEIVKGLLDICGILPDKIKSQCTNIINQYGTVIPELIVEILSPLKVCEVLGLCTQNKVDICTQGPSVWCASMENAQMCNAVAHCKRHVWN